MVEIPGRALARTPRLIILDEPTASFVVNTRRNAFSLVISVVCGMRNRCHLYYPPVEGALAHVADRVTVLRDGRHVVTALPLSELARRGSGPPHGGRDLTTPRAEPGKGWSGEGAVTWYWRRKCWAGSGSFADISFSIRARRDRRFGRLGWRRPHGASGSNLRLWSARSGRPVPGWHTDPYPKSIRCGPPWAGPRAGRPQSKRAGGQRIGRV